MHPQFQRRTLALAHLIKKGPEPPADNELNTWISTHNLAVHLAGGTTTVTVTAGASSDMDTPSSTPPSTPSYTPSSTPSATPSSTPSVSVDSALSSNVLLSSLPTDVFPPPLSSAIQDSDALSSLLPLISTDTPPPPSSTVQDTAETLVADSSTSQTNHRLTPGAYAGIIIAVILLFVAAAFIILRKRITRRRRRHTGQWATYKGITIGTKHRRPNISEPQPSNVVFDSPYGRFPPAASAQAESQSPAPEYSHLPLQIGAVGRVPVPIYTPSVIAPLPATYGNEGTQETSASILLSPVSTNVVHPPVGINAVAFGATIKRSFIPTLPDELLVSLGETVRVLAEYDDGWALCVNVRGEEGVLPVACMEQGAGVAVAINMVEGNVLRASKRASSLPTKVKRV